MKKRLFSGMGYREVQRANGDRRSQLPQKSQVWLKQNGYRNVGWDNVIRLYQKINDLADDQEDSLEDLFLKADQIGEKYQTAEERAQFNQQLSDVVGKIDALVDEQFPEEEAEVIDFSRRR